MPTLPTALHTAAQVRAIDHYGIDTQGIPGYTLMTGAATAALAALRARFPDARRLRIWCGAGNNAGDGYVLARLARAAGLKVETVALVSPERLAGDAARAWQDWRAAGGDSRTREDSRVPDVEVDAMLGTGLDRALTEPFDAVVAALNAAAVPVVALDVPTGLHADTGAALDLAVEAALTVSFVALKQGLFTGAGPAHVGMLVFDDLGVDASASGVPVSMHRLSATSPLQTLSPRRRDSHKGDHGRVLVIGGGRGMPGAARLAAEAALRSGAGRVTVATLPAHVSAVVAARPEIICEGIEPDAEGLHRLDTLLAQTDVLALGPGLGRDVWARALWVHALRFQGPAVLDADALNLLAESPGPLPKQCVLTPHPGEAARLLGCTVRDIQADRPAALAQLCERHEAIVVLKGAGSLVGRRGERPHVCDRGNPGMASAGTGDVLTGAIAGLAAQSGCLWQATLTGVHAHALAGDAAARQGERGLLASDLLAELRACLNS